MITNTIYNPPRPTVTPDMINAAAKRLVSQPYIPLDDAGISKQQAIIDLVECYRRHMDGYTLGKKLDDECCWRMSSAMIDDLESMDHFVEQELECAEANWVIEHSIQPPLPVGAELDIGVITGICDHSPACYLVKPHGDGPDEQTGHRRRIIKFEDAQPCQKP